MARSLPSTIAARPECWSIDGLYMGATPVGFTGTPAPLLPPYFNDDKRFVIGLAVLHEEPPPKWLRFVGCAMVSRAWWEWHWYRQIDLAAQRPAIPASLRRLVLERDGYVCQLCGDDVEPEDIHLDHILPWSLGGATRLSNLQVAHSRCNIRKGNRI